MQMLNYMLLTVVVTGHNCVFVRCHTATDSNATHHAVLHHLMYDDAVCVNSAIEINVLDYNVDVCRRTALHAVQTGLAFLELHA